MLFSSLKSQLKLPTINKFQTELEEITIAGTEIGRRKLLEHYILHGW